MGALPLCSLVLMAFLPVAISAQHSETYTGVAGSSPMRVLIATSPFTGHSTPMLALGEELARRGHIVTVCSLESWHEMKRKSEELGLSYISAGNLSTTEKDMRRDYRIIMGDVSKSLNMLKMYQYVEKVRKSMGNVVNIASEFFLGLDLSAWDLLVVDDVLCRSVACVAKQRGIPVVAAYTKQYSLPPPWSHPPFITSFTDDLSFTERFRVWVMEGMRSLGLEDMVYTSDATREICRKVFSTSPPDGQEYPAIVGSVFGFEYSRTVLPLVEHVGPMLSSRKPELPQDLSKWLEGKPERSVVYISMGSVADVTTDIASAFVRGVEATNLSVVWSLNKLNQAVLSGFTLDSNMFYISHWIPQNTLLQHASLSMTILHAGAGGVHETLYHAVPCIALPMVGDQHGNAARLVSTGAGIRLDMNSLSPENINSAILAIQSDGRYRKEAKRMRELLLNAGGVTRAVDLLESYARLGYQHLVPAYVKYRWSFVQYHCLDVQLLLVAILGSVLYLCRLLCRFFFCRHKKAKKAKRD